MPRRPERKIRILAWGMLVFAGLAAAALRYAILDRRTPRTFSYTMESCFRFRYAEMRMMGRSVPPLDPQAQWPEGFDVQRTILPLPDKTAGLVYRLRGGGDPFLASRATILLFSSLAVLAFVPFALAFFQRAWPAAAAALVYAGSFGAYSRTVGNYLREDFALPGLLVATAGALHVLTGARKGRGLALVAMSLATFWAGSCWHMTQFAITILAALIFVFALAGRTAAAAQAGIALWLGLAAAALANTPLWVKGAMWNVSAAAALTPAAGYLLAKAVRRPGAARWCTLGSGAVLLVATLVLDPARDYGHVFALLWAKIVHLGLKPEPAQLTYDARLYWVGPFDSPGRASLALEYGPVGIAAALGLGCLFYDLIRRRAAAAGAAFAALAAPGFALLYLLMMRMTIFLAPWASALCIYPAARAGSRKARAAWLLPVAFVWLAQLNGIEGFWRPEWYGRAVETLAAGKIEVPWFYGSERASLLRWLASHEPGAVLADFSFSPSILYLAGRPTALHPMFEVPPSVRRKAFTYASAAIADEDAFYALCTQWNIRYVVHFAPQVLDRGSGSFYGTTAVVPQPGSAAWRMQFAPSALKHFRLVWQTYSTRVYETGHPYEGFAARRYHPLFDPAVFHAIPSDEELLAFYARVRRAQSLYLTGVAAQSGRVWGTAAASFTEALRLHPDYEDAGLRLAGCHLALGQRDKARLLLQRAAETSPEDPRVAEYLGLLAQSR